jgi:hypothetical protein
MRTTKTPFLLGLKSEASRLRRVSALTPNVGIHALRVQVWKGLEGSGWVWRRTSSKRLGPLL